MTIKGGPASLLLFFLSACASISNALHVATPSSVSLSRISRFRYDIQSRDIRNAHVQDSHVNHQAKTVIDPLDRTAVNLVHEDGAGDIVACLRVNFGKDGLGKEMEDFLELDQDELDTVAVATRFFFHEDYRGRRLAQDFGKALVNLITTQPSRISYCYCMTSSKLAMLYHRYGFEPVFEKEHPEYGNVVVMRMSLGPNFLSDWSRSLQTFYTSPGEACGLPEPCRIMTKTPLSRSTNMYHNGRKPRSTSLQCKTSPDLEDPISIAKQAQMVEIVPFRERIHTSFVEAAKRFSECTTVQLMRQGKLTPELYAKILREIYYYVREDPQIQALATVYYRGDARRSIKDLMKHAIAEVGHEQLALDDLRTLGVFPDQVLDQIPLTRPLPTTMGLISFAFYHIAYRNPIGHLGYLYFLEFLPTSSGAAILEGLQAAGIPKAATSFIGEHAQADVGHNKLMEGYIADLVRTEEDCNAVVHAIQTTAALYAVMLDGAIAATETTTDGQDLHLPDGMEAMI